MSTLQAVINEKFNSFKHDFPHLKLSYITLAVHDAKEEEDHYNCFITGLRYIFKIKSNTHLKQLYIHEHEKQTLFYYEAYFTKRCLLPKNGIYERIKECHFIPLNIKYEVINNTETEVSFQPIKCKYNNKNDNKVNDLRYLLSLNEEYKNGIYENDYMHNNFIYPLLNLINPQHPFIPFNN